MAKTDPVTREIIQNALAAAADEMSLSLYRTSYSTIVRDCLDYSTSLCNGKGEMIAQGVTIPTHIGSVPSAMTTLFATFGDNMLEGDIFVMNDPFDGGMHIPDIFIVKPVFLKGERVSFAVATAHHLDLGGRLPGSSACDNTEIYQDGFRIPWIKLYDRGQMNETFFKLFRANIRVPHMTVGDVRAQVAACHTGERAIVELIERYGLETFRAVTTDLINYTERLMREEIAAWPDGTYSFTDYMDSDGCGGPPVKLQVAITVAGDSLTADFTGTSEQTRGALNCTVGFVTAVVALCVRSVMQESVPNNAGIFRPLTVIAPQGTVVNAVMPAASSMRGVTGFRLLDAIFGALAQFLPTRVFAAGEGGNSLVVIGGKYPDRRQYVYFECMTGTWGARPDRDGNDGLCNVCNIISNIPIEQAELDYPIRINRYGLVRDSGGAGKFRGGLAVERDWTLLKGTASLTIRSDRRDYPPYGLFGGGFGTPSNSILQNGDNVKILPTMVSTQIEENETIYHRQAGGGGYGNAFERLPASVAWDVKNDKVSLSAAREQYGVVIKPTSLEIDLEATEALRSGAELATT